MNLTPQQIKQTRKVLKTVQIALIAILLVAAWSNGQILLWQKTIATVLGLYLLLPHVKEFISRRNKK